MLLLDLTQHEGPAPPDGCASPGLRLDLSQIDTEVPDGLVQLLAPSIILVSGLEAAADIQRADVALSVIEAESGRAVGSTILIAHCARPSLFLDSTRFSALSRRLGGLVYDEPALARALGLPEADGRGAPAVLQAARARSVLLAADARVPAYLALPETLDDPSALARLDAVAKADGFAGLLSAQDAQIAALRGHA